jgi:7-cyano-7-deazaguanine synthase
MCGISGYWAKESALSSTEWAILLQGVSERGQDGIGIVIYFKGHYVCKKVVGTYEDHKEELLDFLREASLGSVTLLSSRATPETERVTSKDMIQPVMNNGLYLVHNGGVTDSLKKELTFDFQTNIDSEVILAAYRKFSNNMKECMEWLVGSFAFILIDDQKKKLYTVTSFNPLAHMYVRGYGYFLHSDNDCLGRVLNHLTNQSQDGVNVWESWYHHYIDGYTIIETDLESGFQFKKKYKPRFLHPYWKGSDGPPKALVVSSGGIDSGLTAFILSKIGYEVELIHFLYGQKAMQAEEWAVRQLSKYLGCASRFIDLQPFYKSLPEKGMLTSPDIAIDSGGDLIKSTIAWSSGRNAVFASMTMTLAESMITSNKTSQVFISAGWYQLSEETGGYPDNSFQFNEALESLKNYGYIAGSGIKFLPVMQRLTKTEEWVLGSSFDFPFELTVSCDDPSMVDGVPHLCTECGSTKLSILASDRAGVNDLRRFVGGRPRLSGKLVTSPLFNIIDRLVLPQEDKNKLKIVYSPLK